MQMHLDGIQPARKFNPENLKTAFQPDPTKRRQMTMTTESQSVLNHFKKINKSKKIITETLKSASTDTDSGTMLDENNIL